MFKRKKAKELMEADKIRTTTQGVEEISMYLMSYEIYNLIRNDFNYKEALEAKTTKIVGEIYQELNKDNDNDTKLRRIYEIFDAYYIHVGEIDIRMKRGEKKSDA